MDRRPLILGRPLRTTNDPAPPPMKPEYFRHIRKRMGLTQRDLSIVLQMGAMGSRNIRRWEKGEVDIPGPAALAMALLVEKHNISLD